MSRYKRIIFILSVFFIIIVYSAYEGMYLTEVTKYDEFVSSYLNNAQKYLFNITLVVVCMIYTIKIPYLKPEYKIRYGTHIAYFLIEKGILISTGLALFIYVSFLIVPLLFGYQVSLYTINFRDILSLISYIYFLYLTYNVFYLNSDREMLSALITYALPTIILVFYISITFVTIPFSINSETELYYILTGTSVINLFGSIYFIYKLKHKDCLT